MRDLDTNEQAKYMANLRQRSIVVNSEPKLDIEELRGQFQGWLITTGIYSSDFRALYTGEYYMPNIESAWQAWLACAKQNGVLK